MAVDNEEEVEQTTMEEVVEEEMVEEPQLEAIFEEIKMQVDKEEEVEEQAPKTTETNSRMQIYVKIRGSDTIPLDIEPSDTVDDLRERIWQSRDIPPDGQRLIFRGKQLVNGQTLAHNNMQNGSTINLVILQKPAKEKAASPSVEEVERVEEGDSPTTKIFVNMVKS